MYLQGKKIIVGVTGSIAAYKSAFLVRLLKKEGADVQVIMTSAAKDFISPLTLSTLSERPVLSEFVLDKSHGTWTNHVDLGLWADLLLIAPASAHTIASCAGGLCHNLLQSVYLSAKCKVAIAPAMDLDMYEHESTTENLAKLAGRKNHYILDSESGELASGLVGKGRMQEPEHLMEAIESVLCDKPLQGKKVLISSGSTHEKIDPVRYIGNHSTGKMGAALARAFRNAGAEVTVIAGPSQVHYPRGIEVEKVRSAAEMFEAMHAHFSTTDIMVSAAAVADFTIETPADKKIKKESEEEGMQVSLVRTTDILKTLGNQKTHQFVVGFALETNNEEENALRKLEQKNCDLLVLNSMNDKGAGFGHDTNSVTIFGSDSFQQRIHTTSKTEVGKILVQLVTERI